MRCIRVAANALLLSGLIATAHGVDPSVVVKGGSDATDIEVFQGPRLIGGHVPRYPESEKSGRKEGWVQLNMMIDAKGKPYEVTVIDSSGDAALEQAAIRGVNQLVFQPAKRRDTPIDSSFTGKMVFYQSEPSKGASHDFVTAYKKLTMAIDAGDKTQADEELGKLRVQNLYEDAFLGFGKYLYDRRWGTETEQLADLRRAVANEKIARYLPGEAFRAALAAQLTLDVKLKDYGSALDVWKTLEPLASPPQRNQLQPAIDEIKAMQDSDQVIRVSARIEKGTSWHSTLFKNRFDISVVTGAVSEIKLRCKKEYVFFKYQPGVQYSVGRGAGECTIEVVGDPGTMFDLAQS